MEWSLILFFFFFWLGFRIVLLPLRVLRDHNLLSSEELALCCSMRWLVVTGWNPNLNRLKLIYNSWVDIWCRRWDTRCNALHVTVPGFQHGLYSWFQPPAHVHPGKQQMMTEAAGFTSSTREIWTDIWAHGFGFGKDEALGNEPGGGRPLSSLSFSHCYPAFQMKWKEFKNQKCSIIICS